MYALIRRAARGAVVFCLALVPSVVSAVVTAKISECSKWQVTGNTYEGSPIGAIMRRLEGNTGACYPAIVMACALSAPPDTISYTCGVKFKAEPGCGCGAGGIDLCPLITAGSGDYPNQGFVTEPPNAQFPPFSVHCGHYESDGEPDLRKNTGPPCPGCGNPINTGTANKYQREVDYEPAYPGGLEFVRHYNSHLLGETSPLGANWTHSWMRSIKTVSPVGLPEQAHAYRPDGKRLVFSKNAGGGWDAELDVSDRVVQTVSGWTLTSAANDVEQYNSDGLVVSVTDAAGRTAQFVYSDGTANTATAYGTSTALSPGFLISVTDYRGRIMTFKYNGRGYLITMAVENTPGTSPTTERVYTYSVHPDTHDLSSVTYPDMHVRSYAYNEATKVHASAPPHLLSGITDENGHSFANYWFDATGRAYRTDHGGLIEKHTLDFPVGSSPDTTMTNPLGATFTLQHDVTLGVSRQKSSTVNCSNCTVSSATSTKAYDGQGNMTRSQDFNGNVSCFAYELARNLETIRVEGLASGATCTSGLLGGAGVAAPARRIVTSWHATWRIPAQIAEPLRITSYAYHGDPGVSCAPSGASTTLLCMKTIQATTDATGAQGLSATLDGAPRTWSYSYNAAGQLLTADGPRTDVIDLTTYAYYVAADLPGAFKPGDLKRVTNAKGHVTLYTHYDPAGRLARMVDPNGLETTFTYRPRGWLSERSVGPVAGVHEVTTYTYDNLGLISGTTFPDGSTLTYTYDTAHRLTDVEDGLGNKLHYTLDELGNRRVEQALNPLGSVVREHTRAFDQLSRLLKDIGGTNPATQITQYGYDANGNLKTVTDPLARVTTNNYDTRNRLREVIDPFNGATAKTLYDYNGRDQVTKVTDPNGLETSYVLNGHDERKSLTSPNTGTTTYEYDAASNLRGSLDARNVQATYDYDALNRPTQVVYPDETVTYTFDDCPGGLGRLCYVTDATGTIGHFYDVFGRRTRTKSSLVAGPILTVGYTYNAFGQLSEIKMPGGHSVWYTYENNRPVSVTYDGTPILNGAVYEPFGPIGGWTWANSGPEFPNQHLRTFDKDFRSTRISSDRAFIDSDPYGFDRTVEWADVNRVAKIVDNVNPALTTTYGYDALDQLTSANRAGYAWSAVLDGVGNRLSQTTNGQQTTYVPASGTQRIATLSGATNRVYTYDNAGNVQSDGTVTWTFGGNNRPKQFAAGGVSTPLSINALGQRVKKGNTRFAYDESGHLLGEYGSDFTVYAEHVWLGNLPVATVVVKPADITGMSKSQAGRKSGPPPAIDVYYVHSDHLGSPRLITDAGDNVVWKWENLDPFGANPAESLSAAPFANYQLRLPGQYFDSETGNHYNYFRDYDPKIGRYIESDPIGLMGGLNTYSYVKGEPLRYRDPWGLVYGVWCAIDPTSMSCYDPDKPPPPQPDWFPNNHPMECIAQCNLLKTAACLSCRTMPNLTLKAVCASSCSVFGTLECGEICKQCPLPKFIVDKVRGL